MWKVAYKGKPWYNEDWYVNYCNKDDNTVVIFNKMCTQDERLSLYVDVQVQDRSSRAADPYFARLEKMWDEQKYSVVYDNTPVPLGYTRYISKMSTYSVHMNLILGLGSWFMVHEVIHVKKILIKKYYYKYRTKSPTIRLAK